MATARQDELEREITETRFFDSDIYFEKIDVFEYKREWLMAFAPSDIKEKELVKACLDEGCFLWHLFSYEYVSAYEGEHAQSLFDRQFKESAVLIDNIEDVCYRITNLSVLNSVFLEDWIDVTVTAEDFSWTYSKTHELIGPYFYRKG